MRILFAIALVLFATAAGAQDFNSANYRMEGCRAALADRATYNTGYCLGLVDGIVFGEFGHDTYCFPPISAAGAGVTLKQIVRVVVAYIDARPARMHEDFRKLALEALVDAWPCKR
jgi:Rap1a immunity proteins